MMKIKCTIFNSAHDLSSGHRNAGSLTAGCVVSVKSSSQSWMSLDFDSRRRSAQISNSFFLCNKKWFFSQLCAQVFFLFIDMRWKCDLMSLFRSRCTYVIESQKKVCAETSKSMKNHKLISTSNSLSLSFKSIFHSPTTSRVFPSWIALAPQHFCNRARSTHNNNKKIKHKRIRLLIIQIAISTRYKILLLNHSSW